MWYAFWADVIVALHVGYVGFVVVGQLLILLGLIFRWQWVRNPTFRILHLIAILIVAAEASTDVTCPLTKWEWELRALAGQSAEQVPFMMRITSYIGSLSHNILFYEGLDNAAFQKGHIAFGILVLVTFLLAPPRLGWVKRWWKKEDSGAGTALAKG